MGFFLGGNMSYKIYPLVHEINYTGDSISMPESISVEAKPELSSANLHRLEEGLSLHNIQIMEDAETVICIELEEKFNAIDEYELAIEAGKWSIKAKDERAIFYALTTLYHVLEQSKNEILTLNIHDFATYPFRGMIEGYYGIPFGNAKRKEILDFTSYFKGNVFAFAPKDDPYHRDKWWEPYPEAELEEIAELAKFAEQKAITYYWTISPFVVNDNQIKADNKEEGLEKLINKFETLYEVGVRGFGVLGDDVGGLDFDTVVYLMNNLNKWRKEKGDVAPLFFCPEAYCLDEWAFKDGSELNYYHEHFDKDIEIFYTGLIVCGTVSQEAMDGYMTKAVDVEGRRRAPLFWMNWPVNDIDHKTLRRLFMGPGEIFQTGKTQITGVLTNPMEQAEASKVSLFATLDYNWNAEAFDAETSWEESFKYIDAGAPAALHEICKHLSSQEEPAATHDAKESEAIKALHKQLEAGEDKNSVLPLIIKEYNKVLDSIEEYRNNKSNANLYEEMEQWLNALEDKAKTGIFYAEAILNNNSEKKAEAEKLHEQAFLHKISSNSKDQLYANPGADTINKNLELLKKL